MHTRRTWARMGRATLRSRRRWRVIMYPASFMDVCRACAVSAIRWARLQQEEQASAQRCQGSQVQGCSHAARHVSYNKQLLHRRLPCCRRHGVAASAACAAQVAALVLPAAGEEGEGFPLHPGPARPTNPGQDTKTIIIVDSNLFVGDGIHSYH